MQQTESRVEQMTMEAAEAQWIASSEADTVRLAGWLAERAEPGTVIALDGDLGAGKTRFSQAFAAALAVEGVVSSPTFTIIKEYESGRLPLYHMDVYRLSPEEADELGLDEYWYGRGVSLVEWASLIPELLPERKLSIRIVREDGERRGFALRGEGLPYAAWVREWLAAAEAGGTQAGLLAGQAKAEAGEPLVLALDTATPTLAAALMRGSEALGSVQEPAARNHSAHAVPAVQRLLREAGLRGTELAGIAAGVGPGSYTGVRIAASIAKTLAWTWGVPLVGVSTPEALAAGAWREAAGLAAAAVGGADDGSGEPAAGARDGGTLGLDSSSLLADEAGGWIVPLLDARRGQAYTALFAAGAAPGYAEGQWLPADAPWRRLEPDALRLMDGWAARLAELLAAADRRPAYVLFTGDLDKHEDSIRRFEELAEAGGDGPAVCRQPHTIDGRTVAWLGARSLAGGEAVDAHGLVPNYTQLAEAEAKLLEKSREEKNDGRL